MNDAFDPLSSGPISICVITRRRGFSGGTIGGCTIFAALSRSIVSTFDVDDISVGSEMSALLIVFLRRSAFGLLLDPPCPNGPDALLLFAATGGVVDVEYEGRPVDPIAPPYCVAGDTDADADAGDTPPVIRPVAALLWLLCSPLLSK